MRPATAAIGSEDTLKMIMQAIKSETGAVEPNSGTVEIKAELDTGEDEAKKKVKKPKKTKKPKAEIKPAHLDGLTRFFNDYGESPHLQAIETSYLRYLEAQHAKESHLKDVKRFQIVRALKTIQRFWKKKYQEILHRCARKIQSCALRWLERVRLRN